MQPIIFEDYNFNRAETQFPLINPKSSRQEISDTAWAYASDVLCNDPMSLQDAFIGEYLGNLGVMEDYHRKVLLAVVEKNYEEVGKLVEDAMSDFVKIAVNYIEEHITQMEMRYE